MHELLVVKASQEDTIAELNRNKTRSFAELEKELQKQRNESKAFLTAAGRAQERVDALTREFFTFKEESRQRLEAEKQRTVSLARASVMSS